MPPDFLVRLARAPSILTPTGGPRAKSRAWLTTAI